MKNYLLAFVMLCITMSLSGAERSKINFNQQWLLRIGDVENAQAKTYDDRQWQPVTLPYAFNGDEAFRKDIVNHRHGGVVQKAFHHRQHQRKESVCGV